MDSEALSKELKEGPRVKMYMTGDKVVRVPLLVIELKRASVTTDAIRSRTIIAREMKEVFPFVGYFFVADETGKMPETIYRQGKHFDGVFVRPDTADQDWIEHQLIEAGIEPHLRKLENLDVLPGPGATP